ncbi:P-loop NTPase fold protein [Glycomyces dulcitolivorans]|uniref:P-loop NTPase fold protein n=1 Tax=Glycomyces dulcitolivorans TaxID=2200759 RepID=UPI001300B54F|nr:P-loop NTPase fold protein [Glycomyces dulcitolivorans]
MDATRVDIPTKVRYVDPFALLMIPPSEEPLEPYPPREVDADLDRALASLGFVMIQAEDIRGARRSAFEALLRNLPDALLITHDNGVFRRSGADILWVDYDNLTPGWLRVELPPMQEWQAREKGRRVLVIATEAEIRSLSNNQLKTMLPRIVRFPTEPTADDSSSADTQALPPEEELAAFAAGYHADTDTGADLLDISADVNMLADLVASRNIAPPLSVGLFGDWGSGKSFFMRRMRERVRELAKATARAEHHAGQRGPAVSAYCSSIRQITFNAWHYAESNLWASLATHLLDNLASTGPEDDLERLANDLAESRRDQSSLLDQLSSVRMERALLTAQLERESKQARDFAREATEAGTKLRNLWRRMPRSPAAWAVIGLGVIATVLAYLFVQSPAWTWIIGMLTVPASALTQLSALRQTANWIRHTVSKRVARTKKPLRTRLDELHTKQEQLERAIADLTPTHDLTAYARDRGSDYQQHLGVVSLVHRDLQMFAAMLARDRDPADPGTGPERIVLYIDDLDRCPPDVVVRVLEAIHLLLAQPVFAIVVGADANWLLRSLTQHYGTVLDNNAGGARHYLEKIFQIPLTLAPMTTDGFTRLVTDLGQGGAPEAAPDATEPETEPAPVDQPRTAAPQTVPEARRPPTEPSGPHLLPRRLEITEPELDYIASLAPMVRSPRNAKRLINLYRLLRARLRDDQLPAFLNGDQAGYRVVVPLLALMSGTSDTSTLFHAIENADVSTTWRSLLDADPRLGTPELQHLSATALVPPGLTAYKGWLPLVRRFSFTTA